MGLTAQISAISQTDSSTIMQFGCLAASLAGLVFHQYYKAHEPTLATFFINLGAFALLMTATQIFFTSNTQAALMVMPLYLIVHLAALGTSIAVYRLFFHPLRKFPGPWSAKLTKWTAAYHSSTGYLHVWLPELHKKYGKVVRVGPNELSFSDPADVKYLHGPQGARLEKGPYYDASKIHAADGGDSMPGTRNWEDHRIRRRVWDRGFSQKQLKTYEPSILKLVDIFLNNMERFDGQVVDFREWFDYFTFDAMGVLAFDYNFNMMSDDGPRAYSEFIRSGMKVMHIFANVPWFSHLAPLLPLGGSESRRDLEMFKTISQKQYAERRLRGTDPNDLFSHLIEGNKDGHVTCEKDLEADSPALFVAGSDTSSIVLTFLFYYLTRDKVVYARLRDEIDQVWDGKTTLEAYMLAPEKAPYLNGAIYEAMRLSPPGPNGMQRRTLKGGHMVNGRFIPEYTQVSSNTLALQHNPDNFTQPLDYIPERWIDEIRDSKWNHDVRAFIPFTSGTFACAGRALALVELRLFTAKVMKNVDLIMPDDFDHEEWWRNVKSFQSMIMGPLRLIVKSR